MNRCQSHWRHSGSSLHTPVDTCQGVEAREASLSALATPQWPVLPSLRSNVGVCHIPPPASNPVRTDTGAVSLSCWKE